MNCSVCGSPLLFDRVVFRCACGAFVHAYCVDKHIVDSHRPELEEGYADLNGEFHLKYQPVAPSVESLEESAVVPTEDEDEGAEEELSPGEQILEDGADVGEDGSDEDTDEEK